MTAALAARPPPAAAFWWRAALRVVGVCAFVTLFFCLLERSFAGFVGNFVYSEAIGLSIFAGYAGLWKIGAAYGSRLSRSFWRGVIAIPTGFVVGSVIAALLLDQKVRLPSPGNTSPFALGISVITSVCVIYYFWARGRLAEAARTEADASRATAEARLALLQAQIEPHMLFNTLANLRTLVDVDPLRAQAMIDQLIVYLRGTLSASRRPTTTLEAEFAQLAAYLELMQVRMATRLRFTLSLPDELRAAAIPPMLLQPLVENAIKHGLEPKIAGGSIRVTATSSGGTLRLDVRDDGIGLDADADADADAVGSGYGLEHVRERLRTRYGAAGRLSLTAHPAGGTLAVVELPA